MGLTLPASNQAAFVQNFLKIKFNVECSYDSIKILAKLIIVDLKCSEVKANVIKKKKEILSGTNIFIEPDRTSKESLEDWHLRTVKRQLEKEGRNVTRRRITLMTDDKVYR